MHSDDTVDPDREKSTAGNPSGTSRTRRRPQLASAIAHGAVTSLTTPCTQYVAVMATLATRSSSSAATSSGACAAAWRHPLACPIYLVYIATAGCARAARHHEETHARRQDDARHENVSKKAATGYHTDIASPLRAYPSLGLPCTSLLPFPAHQLTQGTHHGAPAPTAICTGHMSPQPRVTLGHSA